MVEVNFSQTRYVKSSLAEDWFSIDPQSFNLQQLHAYKKAIFRCKKISRKGKTSSIRFRCISHSDREKEFQTNDQSLECMSSDL